MLHKSLTSQNGEKLRDWLKAGRARSGLSMRLLGQELGVPFQFVSKVEKGERRLDVVEYVAYCEAIGADPLEGINLLLTAK